MLNQNDFTKQAFDAVLFRIRLERQLNTEYERGKELLEEQLELIKQRGELLEEQRYLQEALQQENIQLSDS